MNWNEPAVPLLVNMFPVTLMSKMLDEASISGRRYVLSQVPPMLR